MNKKFCFIHIILIRFFIFEPHTPWGIHHSPLPRVPGEPEWEVRGSGLEQLSFLFTHQRILLIILVF